MGCRNRSVSTVLPHSIIQSSIGCITNRRHGPVVSLLRGPPFLTSFEPAAYELARQVADLYVVVLMHGVSDTSRFERCLDMWQGIAVSSFGHSIAFKLCSLRATTGGR